MISSFLFGFYYTTKMKYDIICCEEQWQPKNILVTFRMYQLNFDGDDSRVYREYWKNSKVHFIEKDI